VGSYKSKVTNNLEFRKKQLQQNLSWHMKITEIIFFCPIPKVIQITQKQL